MANEAKVVWASAISHITAANAVLNNAMSAEVIDVALSSTNLLDYPLADVVLYATWGTGPTVNNTIELYRNAINIGGNATWDEPVPSSTYFSHLVGVFVCSAATTQYLLCQDVKLTKECEFQIYNRSAQTISAGWTLTIIPKTMGT